MSENMHTQEPWDISIDDDQWPVVMASGKIVANVNPESFFAGVADLVELPAYANASRIVACVNACAGISTEALEIGAIQSRIESAIGELYEVKQQRDTLLSALQAMIDAPTDQTILAIAARRRARDAARAAIAAAKPKDNESNKEAA